MELLRKPPTSPDTRSIYLGHSSVLNCLQGLAHIKCLLNARTGMGRTPQNQNCPHNQYMEKSHILPRGPPTFVVLRGVFSRSCLCFLHGPSWCSLMANLFNFSLINTGMTIPTLASAYKVARTCCMRSFWLFSWCSR